MVWILSCECPSDSEVSVFVFGNETDAYQDAAADIQAIISDDWDMEDLSHAEEAKVINDFVSAGRHDKGANLCWCAGTRRSLRNGIGSC